MRVRSVAKFVIVSGALLAGCEIRQNLGTHADAGAFALGGSDAAAPRGSGAVFFVTEGRYSGDLGGLAGADAICVKEAKAAGLGGEFKAWLSTSSENAKDRIAPLGPWRRVDNQQLFAGPAVSGLPENFPAMTATGTDLMFNPNDAVWTGTQTNGRWSNGHSCNDWTSAASSARGSFGECTFFSERWTEALDLNDAPELLPCNTEARLYCFGQ